MKKLMILGFIILATISCKAQQIIPVEQLRAYMDDADKSIPDGAYLKDVNHVLDRYVGIWKGTYDAKRYEFRIVKFFDTAHDRGITEDKLLMRYIITDANGTELENTTALPDTNSLIINGYYLTRGFYVLNYHGQNYKCGQKGEISISTGIKTNYTQMSLFLSPEMEWEPTLSECPNGISPQIIPTEQMRLTKQ